MQAGAKKYKEELNQDLPIWFKAFAVVAIVGLIALVATA